MLNFNTDEVKVYDQNSALEITYLTGPTGSNILPNNDEYYDAAIALIDQSASPQAGRVTHRVAG